TKLVVMMTMDGASDSTVINPTSCTTRWVRPAPVPRSILMADPPAAAWAASCASAPRGQTRHRAVVISDNRAARFNSARLGRAKIAWLSSPRRGEGDREAVEGAARRRLFEREGGQGGVAPSV